MNWLIRLYPPAWRRRYGQELEELLDERLDLLRDGADDDERNHQYGIP